MVGCTRTEQSKNKNNAYHSIVPLQRFQLRTQRRDRLFVLCVFVGHAMLTGLQLRQQCATLLLPEQLLTTKFVCNFPVPLLGLLALLRRLFVLFLGLLSGLL